MDKLQRSRQTRRFLAVTVLFTVILLGIMARLYFLQVVKGTYYAGVAEDNRLRIISTDAPRGEIRDRNGVVLATDVPSFDIVVTTYDLKNSDQELGVVAQLTGAKLQTLKDTVKKAGVGPYTPITVARNVSKVVALKLAEKEPDLPGIQLVMSAKRSYPQGTLAAHVLGYTGEIGDTELQALQTGGYVMKDTIGKDGVELQYESLLRGQKSQKLIEVDAGGKAVKTLQEKPGVPGKSIILTIDARLQKTCEGLLGDNQGAAIIMDPRNGELLALASAPTFDPNKFISGISSQDWKTWSAKGSLFDRAIAGMFPPASTFKVVTGTAGLETHTITDRSIIYCGGGLTVGGRLFKCWIWPGRHGNENIYRGYADSCDSYFFTVARLTGIESMDTYAHKFGPDTEVEAQQVQRTMVRRRYHEHGHRPGIRAGNAHTQYLHLQFDRNERDPLAPSLPEGFGRPRHQNRDPDEARRSGHARHKQCHADDREEGPQSCFEDRRGGTHSSRGHRDVCKDRNGRNRYAESLPYMAGSIRTDGQSPGSSPSHVRELALPA